MYVLPNLYLLWTESDGNKYTAMLVGLTLLPHNTSVDHMKLQIPFFIFIPQLLLN